MVLIFTSTIGAFILVQKVSRKWIAEINVQQKCSMIAAKIIRGNSEGGDFVGLRSANEVTSALYNDTRESGITYKIIDGEGVETSRSYSVSGNRILYTSPAQSPNQKAIYAPQANQTVELWFWKPEDVVDGQTVDGQTVAMQISISQVEPPVTGCVTTYINLRKMNKT